jgi:hypothetical protein
MSDNTTTRILAIQRAVACAPPSGWRDAVVVAVEHGTVQLATLAGSLGDLRPSTSTTWPSRRP